MDPGVVETLAGIAVTVLVGVVTPTLFQMIWGRPRLVYEFCRSQDEDNRLFLIFRNPPVTHKGLIALGVVRTPNGIQGTYSISNACGECLGRAIFLFRLNTADEVVSVSLPDHGWAISICVVQQRIGRHGRTVVGSHTDDSDACTLKPGCYLFEGFISTSQGSVKLTRGFEVAEDDLRWLPDTSGRSSGREGGGV